jgi:peptide/nickel transport system substrate-binding protein
LEVGRTITFAKNPDWWGRGLPINAGKWNFDQIRYEWFKDGAGLFEAFKSGEIDVFRDGDPGRWQDGYDFPAARDGLVRQAEIPHGRPSGMTGFVFNMRRAPFDDRRVRLALAEAFDFEWVNAAMNRGAYTRIESFFGGTPLGFKGPAEGREREILLPYAADLPEGALDRGFDWPVSDGSGRSRKNLRRAKKLLAEAGWRVEGGALRNADGAPLRFEILLAGSSWEGAAATFADALKRLGIEATLRSVDAAQYQARLVDYDYDMVVRSWAMSLSPGNEQRFYWGSDGATRPGTRNYMGLQSPAAEAAIAALLASDGRADFEAASRALDRVLTNAVPVIPLWHAPVSRIAAWDEAQWPARLPLYGDWTGWLPDVWWRAGSGG